MADLTVVFSEIPSLFGNISQMSAFSIGSLPEGVAAPMVARFWGHKQLCYCDHTIGTLEQQN